jgi:molybdopterin molybdotransferase
MRSHTEHQQAVAALLAPVLHGIAGRAQTVPLAEASGRVLAADLVSPIDLPPFANSQMDGYAVRSADLESADAAAPVVLSVGPTTAAGDAPGALDPGFANPVMTGAAIPAGADAVVQIEKADPASFQGIGGDVRHAPDGAVVRFAEPVASGTFIRDAGTDVAAGEPLLTAGTRLGPAQVGSLASAGITLVEVRPRPLVLLVSTGHELRTPGDELTDGTVYDANSAMLSTALQDAGADVITATAPDEVSEVIAAIGAHPDVDLVVTTGGVSAGAFEVVREALAPLGVRFESVALQPGGPQGLGVASLPSGAQVPVVSFPGNPVSSLISFELFLRPVLRASAGLPAARRALLAPLAHDITSVPARHQVRRGTLRADGSVEVGHPSSHLLHAYALADALVHVPVGVASLPAGAEVEVWLIDE